MFSEITFLEHVGVKLSEKDTQKPPLPTKA